MTNDEESSGSKANLNHCLGNGQNGLREFENYKSRWSVPAPWVK